MIPQKQEAVLVVGAGVFGLSLAYELAAKRGYTNVTVLDRFLPPVVDGSSVDISRIIRSDYADPLYEALGREAVEGWRGPEYSAFYHESGFAMITSEPEHPYITGVRQVQETQGAEGKARVFEHDRADADMKGLYPGLKTDLRGFMASLNPEGGWADAAASIRALAERASLAGVSFATGKNGTVVRLETKGSRVVGVHVASGAFLPAARVVLAAGAWTNGVVEGVDHAVLASAQPVGFIQLTAEEAEEIKEMPVITNMDTGVFCFPPTPGSHIIKVARHGYGYTTRYETTGHSGTRVVSTPKRDGSNEVSHFLPEDAEKALREGVRHFFPSIADRPWMRRRLCWYLNTPAGDFVVDDHPRFQGLFVATGGSGQ